MKSVGEAMAIGRTFKEALQKGFRSLEIGVHGIIDDRHPTGPDDIELIRQKLTVPNKDRIFFIRYALKAGWTSMRSTHSQRLTGGS